MSSSSLMERMDNLVIFRHILLLMCKLSIYFTFRIVTSWSFSLPLRFMLDTIWLSEEKYLSPCPSLSYLMLHTTLPVSIFLINGSTFNCQTKTSWTLWKLQKLINNIRQLIYFQTNYNTSYFLQHSILGSIMEEKLYSSLFRNFKSDLHLSRCTTNYRIFYVRVVRVVSYTLDTV